MGWPSKTQIALSGSRFVVDGRKGCMRSGIRAWGGGGSTNRPLSLQEQHGRLVLPRRLSARGYFYVANDGIVFVGRGG